MARPLVFQFRDRDYAFQPVKVDRSKLYGFKEVEVLDEQERPCELATLADDGRTLVGRGGTGIGQLSPDGLWCEKAELRPVDLEGREITPVPSSFGAPIPLHETVSVEKYFDHTIKLAYQLRSEGDDDIAPLREELESGAIFAFPYSYRGGLAADAGFLHLGADGELFLTVGNPTSVRFVGLQQAGVAVADEPDAEDDEDDLMDFGMI
jgi:hypothetical protein